MAEPTSAPKDGPSKPICLRYPDLKSDIRLGEGVYFKPLVTVEGKLDEDDERTNFEDFLELAQGMIASFAANASEEAVVKLDEGFIKDVWDASASEADGRHRLNWAVNELVDILDKTPHAGFGEGVEAVDQEIWKNAKLTLLTELMNAGVAKGLTFTPDPELPEGLSMADGTGIISGHPRTPCPLRCYTVYCKSELGQVECRVELEVVEATAPGNMEYNKAERVYTCGQPMVIMPLVTGLVTAWSIRPSLPKGLKQDSFTGTICGIPQESQGETTYTVVAKNDLGSTSCKVKFEVVQAPPTNLRFHADEHTDYAANRLGFCGRQAAHTFPVSRWMCLRPTVEGNADVWEVKPDFPAGVALDPQTGVISGTPTSESPTTSYTILARNEGGAGKVQVSFAIKKLPTIGISYPTFDEVYCVGEHIDCTPQVQGGATTWAAEPDLPVGMSLDASSGRVQGYCAEPIDESCYTITASNEVGGTSCVLTFKVVAMPPEGLSYLEMASEYFVGEDVLVEADLLCGEGNVDFFVSPELPEGLSIHKDKGTISGIPKEEMESRTYVVDAENAMGKTTCRVEFRIKARPETSQSLKASTFGAPIRRSSSNLKPSPLSSPRADVLPTLEEEKEEDDNQLNDFIQQLQNVEDPRLLPPEPDKASAAIEWMLWASHRAMLCDPTLTTLSFKGLDIPMPEVEPRIIGKLVQALTVNRYLVSLDLSATSLRAPHIVGIAQALRSNAALQILNLDYNWLDSSDVEAIINALAENQSSKLTALLCDDQYSTDEFGKATEQQLAQMLEKNTKITKCNMPVEDPHWKSVVDRCLKRNTDQTKRSAKMKTPARSKVHERNLASMTLNMAPEKAATDVFMGADEKLGIARLFTFEKKRLPTKDQLQVFARNRGQPLKYSEVAPLAKGFRKMLLDSMVEFEVLATDITQKKVQGRLKAWSEKNDKWSIDVETEGGTFRFTSIKDPVLDISLTVKEWLAVGMAAAVSSATE